MPSLKLPDRLAVDANAILSALISQKSLRVFTASGIREFATTAFTVQEVRDNLPTVTARLKLDLDKLEKALPLLPLTIYPPATYAGQLARAKGLIQNPKDEELLALALELQLPVWTKDADFEGTGVECFNTGQLLRLMEGRSRRRSQPPPSSP